MAQTHLIEAALPTDPSKGAGLIDGHGYGRERSQSEVNCLTLGCKLITPHHLSAGPVVDVYV